MAQTVQPKKERFFTNHAIRILILVLASVLAFGALVGPDLLDQKTQMVSAGEVAPQEILAPYSVTYESRVYTESARDNAASEVPPVYLPPDPDIAKTQLEKLENAIYFIATVRNDSFATEGQKIQDLKSLPELQLSDSEYQEILELEEADWLAISSEASRVLEIVLRDSIRNNQLGTVKNNLPAIIDFSFKSDQTKLIIGLTSSYIVPTSLFSEEQTQYNRDQARAAVVPITRQIIAGEVIVRRGEVVNEADIEALNTFGLGEPEDPTKLLLASAAIIAVAIILVLIFYRKNRKKIFSQVSSIALITFFFLLFLILARFLVMERTILPYLFPLAAFGLTLSIIFNLEFGFHDLAAGGPDCLWSPTRKRTFFVLRFRPLPECW